MQSLKETIVVGAPVICILKGTPALILGYNDDLQCFYVRSGVNGFESWVPYSWITDEAMEGWTLKEGEK
jgi:hypothetical protein